jgi:hypothetical protein
MRYFMDGALREAPEVSPRSRSSLGHRGRTFPSLCEGVAEEGTVKRPPTGGAGGRSPELGTGNASRTNSVA